MALAAEVWVTPIETILLVASIVLIGFSAITRPTQARCPHGWWLPEGIRRDGSFECRPTIIGGDDDVLTGERTSYQPPGSLDGRIYCTPSSTPIILRDGVTVRCKKN